MSEFLHVAPQPEQTNQVEPSPPVADEQAQPEYFTRADFEKAKEDMLEQMRRMAQSQTDKSTSALRRQMEDRISAVVSKLQAAGAPEAVIQRQVDRLWDEAAGYEEPDDVGQAVEQSGPTPEDIEWVNSTVLQAADELNVGPLLKSDPEYNQVDYNERDPKKFVEQYLTALQNKSLRKYGVNAPTRLDKVSQARAPIFGQGQSAQNTESLPQLTQRLQTLQLKTSRTDGEWAEMKELEAKIRKLL